MEKHPIQGLMDTTMENIRGMVDVNTVLGEAIIAQDGSTVVPISKVSFGFVAGGGEYSAQTQKEQYPFAGGAGAGVTIQPVGFLVCGDSHVRMLPAQTKCTSDRVIDLIPGILEEVKAMLTKMNGKCAKKPPAEAGDPMSAPTGGSDEALPEVPAE
jgi:sporulation protein YtfJ